MTRYKKLKVLKHIGLSAFRYLFLIGLSFLILYPLTVTVLISFMTSDDIFDSAVRFIPKTPSFLTYKDAIIFLEYQSTILKSVVINIVLCSIEMIVCLLVAFGFARFSFKGKGLLFGCVLLTLLVPGEIYYTPLYISFQSYGPFNWNLLNTPIPLFLMSLTAIGIKNGLIIYIMRQFFQGYPKELEEAASIDGAGTLRIFTKIMLPGALSVTATCFMFTFVWKWTDPTFTELFMPGTEFIWNKLATIGSRME